MIKGGVLNTVTVGVVILWTGTSCPTGFTRVTALDNRFLQANTTYNAAAGGASTHQHPSHSHSTIHNVSITTSSAANPVAAHGTTPNAEPASHNHSTTTVSFTSAAVQVDVADNQPAFATLLLCQKD